MKLKSPLLLSIALLANTGGVSASSETINNKTPLSLSTTSDTFSLSRVTNGEDKVFENNTEDIIYENTVAVEIGGNEESGIVNAARDIIFSGNTGRIDFISNTAFNGQLHAGNDVQFTSNTGVIQFKGNTTRPNKKGAAIYADGAVNFTANTSEIIFDTNKAGTGGAIYAIKDVTFTQNEKDITFSLNESDRGGAIYAEGQVQFIGNKGDLNFLDNKSKRTEGGAIYSKEKVTLMSHEGSIRFGGNTANYGGGAIYSYNDISFSVNNAGIRFTSNVAGNEGGAIYASGNMEIFDNVGLILFMGNKAGSTGGALYGQQAIKFTNNDATIIFSQNQGSFGGVIYAKQEISFSNNKQLISFEGNISTVSGGAIYGSTNVSFKNNEGGIAFTNNEAVSYGGAIYASKLVEFIGNKGELSFTGNKTSDTSGVSAIYSQDINFSNNENIVFTGNVGGGAVINTSSSFQLINNGSFSMESNTGSCSIATNDLIIAGNRGDVSISGTKKSDATMGLAIVQKNALSNVQLAANEGKKIELKHGSSFKGNVIINGTTDGINSTVSTGTVHLGNGGETAGKHIVEKDLTVKGGTLALDLNSSLLFKGTSPQNMTIEQGATLANNGTIEGGNISINSGATLSGSGLFDGSTVVMQNQARWNIGNGPSAMRMNNSHITVGSNCAIAVSLDGRTAASVGSPSGWGSGTYSVLIVDGGSTLNQLNANSTVNIVMSSNFKNGLVLGEYNDTLFDFIKKSADSTGDFSLLNQQNVEFFVTNGVSEINVTAALGNQFVINSGDGTFSLQFDVEQGTSIPDPAIPTLGNSALASMVGNSLWGSAFTLRQMNDVIQNSSGMASVIPLNEKYTSQAWFSALGGYNTIESSASAMGASYQQYGYALGAQTQLHSSTTAGMAIGQSWGKTNLDQSSGKIDQDMLMVGLYSDSYLYKTDKAFYTLQFGATYGSDSNVGDVEGERGKWNNNNWMISALAKANYIITPKTIISPLLGLEWNYSKSEDFTTTGGHNLHYAGDSLSSLRARIGVAASQQFSAKWTAYTSISLLLDMARNNPESMVYQGSTPWMTTTTKLGRTSFAYQVGSSYAFTPQWSANVGYALEVNSQTLQQSGNVGVSYKF